LRAAHRILSWFAPFIECRLPRHGTATPENVRLEPWWTTDHTSIKLKKISLRHQLDAVRLKEQSAELLPE